MDRKAHWFIRFLPLWVLVGMVAIPAISIWTHGKWIEARSQAEKRAQHAKEIRQLYLSGAADDTNAQLDMLIEDVSKGDWTHVPQEWRQAAHEILGPTHARHIRRALQDNPPTESDINSLLQEVLGE